MTIQLSTRALITILTVTAAFAVTHPALATGTFYVDASTGDDANNCTTVSTPCKTITAAQTLIFGLSDPANTTLRLAGTFTEAIEFSSSSVTLPDTLKGLHITSTDHDAPAIIDATGLDAGVYINGVHSVEIDHLTIDHGRYGIQIQGSSINVVNGTSIHHNTVQNQAADATSIASIFLQYVKNATVKNNTVTGGNYTLTDGSSYHYVYGVYGFYLYDSVLQDNTISNLTITNDSVLENFHYSYVYGVYLYGAANINAIDNTFQNLSATETGSAVSSNQQSIVVGLYAYDVIDLQLLNSTVTDLSATANLTGSSSTGSSQLSAFTLFNIRHAQLERNLLRNNAISNLTVTSTAKTATASVRGFDIDFSDGVMLRKNTLDNFTATTTSAESNGSSRPSVAGIDGPSTSSDAVIRNNTIKNLTTLAQYTADDSSSNYAVYPISLSSSDGITIKQNTVSDATMTTENNDTVSFYDTGSFFGVYLAYVTNGIVQKNTIHTIHQIYDTAGTGGASSFSQYGFYYYNSPGIQAKRNTIHTTDVTVNLADPTSTSYSYMYVYGHFAISASNGVFAKNSFHDVTNTITGITDNTLSLYTYGMSISGSSGVQLMNNKIFNITDTITPDNGAYDYLYGVYVVTSPQAVLQNNAIHDLSNATAGTSAYNRLYGLFVGDTRPVYVNSNTVRSLTSTSGYADAHEVYGMYFNADASTSRIYNNIVQGGADFGAEAAYGIYLPNQSNTVVYLYHNTVTDWLYPMYLGGGSKMRIYNNIFSAVGNNAYPIALAWDVINRDTLHLDYNVLYNVTVADQLIYDTDNDAAIALGDWQNTTGSYGYDIHSVNLDPKLTTTGRLKKSSPARNIGTTKKYDVEKKSVDYQLLQHDVNGNVRLPAKEDKVDIGADEYKK
ncbi:MAG: hypothetical protein HYV33_00100 [Candidatus Kerfeldbacteria bacterium]|nr:hypothetical protein [Candidatus Kerfeldbacteria bacterium]